MLKKDGLCLNRFYCCNGEKVFSTVGTQGWNKGLHHSEETKQKISLANKGVPRSEETRKRMSISKKGTHPSEETRKKLSETHKGQSAWNKGMHHSEETRKKMSETHKGRIKISIEGNVFDSLTEAAKYYNMSTTAISYWLKTKKHNAIYAI